MKSWLEQQAKKMAARQLNTKTFRIERALAELNLKTAADLDDLAGLHDRLCSLEKKGTSRKALRRCYQEPLKQFSSWLAENGRHLDRDPLASWAPLEDSRKVARSRRAFLPEEVARAFLALELLDKVKGRDHSPRMIFLLLLVCGPRVNALLSRDIEHFDSETRRIDFGEDVGKKRKGAGALDDKTLEELAGYVAGRAEGPLVLSPKGSRCRYERLLDWWREAFSLGLVDELWPEDEEPSLQNALLVNAALLSGKAKVSRGGSPKRLKPETKRKRSELEKKVLLLADKLRPSWQERMEGVDVHAFRKTHRTWAQARGVPPVLIDKQLGHASNDDSPTLLRLIAGSETGRRHYLDMSSAILDASRSASAVREFLDEALLVLKNQTGEMVPILVPITKKASA